MIAHLGTVQPHVGTVQTHLGTVQPHLGTGLASVQPDPGAHTGGVQPQLSPSPPRARASVQGTPRGIGGVWLVTVPLLRLE